MAGGKQQGGGGENEKERGGKRALTGQKILERLPKECFTFEKPVEERGKKRKPVRDEEEKKPEEAFGLDLSNLGAKKLDPKALDRFGKLRRLVLKNNDLEELPTLPSKLTFLDVSNNANLRSLSFLKGLTSLKTLIISECPLLGEILTSKSAPRIFSSLKSLVVLVMDRCGLRGTLDLDSVPFTGSLNTLIVSHNNIEKINVRNCEQLVKLSASNNPDLRKIKRLSDKIAEIRLSNCPNVESLSFLSKRQNKLALLDLSSSPLITNWDDLKSVLNVSSLLTLSLKLTPLHKQFTSAEDFQRACFSQLKCNKLRTLNFSKLLVLKSAFKEETVSDDDDDEKSEISDGENFEDLIVKEDEDDSQSSAGEDEDANQEKNLIPDDSGSEPEVEQPCKKVKVIDDADGLFTGQGSGW